MTVETSRRIFLQAAAATTLGVTGAIAADDSKPAESTTKQTASSRADVVIGQGEYQYRVNHQAVHLPDKYRWQFTHNVAVDSANNIYVIHEGEKDLKDHPSIFVFDAEGTFIRAFGSQFQGGGHGIEIRREGKEDFLYVAAYQQVKSFAKLTTTGEIVWYQKAPMASGKYARGQDTSTKRQWNRKSFLPTNFTFLDDGGFLLADGYGSFFIHEFDKDARWVRCFGGPGEGEGTFKTSHGLWVDRRPGRSDPSLVVTDRERNTLQRLTLDGDYIETIDGFLKPANIDVWENQMLVSELNARLTLLDENNEVLVRLDEGLPRSRQIGNLRDLPNQWQDGHFIAPHDACFDQQGDILVAERIPSGRITRLTRVS